MLFDIIFCVTAMFVRSLNCILAAIDMFKWKQKEAVVFDILFTFMHLAGAFIQSDLQCIQAIHFIVSMCHMSYVTMGIKTSHKCQ